MFLDEKRHGEVIDAVGFVLLAAADDLEAHGHIYEQSGDCVVVAIGRNSPGDAERMAAFDRLQRYLGLHPTGRWIPLVYWNDTSTTQQVVAALRGAA
jgi:hypothetical protein